VAEPDATYLHCSLCGLGFEKADSVCGHGCPLGSTCGHVRCPGCGFEFPDPTRPGSLLRRLFGWRRKRAAASEDGSLGLDGVGTGARYTVDRLSCASAGRRNKLTVFGLVPGAELTLLQRHPSFVIRVGETELGLDAEIAREIRVRRERRREGA
jgi:Fe2+ transport system protein FeoA